MQPCSFDLSMSLTTYVGLFVLLIIASFWVNALYLRIHPVILAIFDFIRLGMDIIACVWFGFFLTDHRSSVIVIILYAFCLLDMILFTIPRDAFLLLRNIYPTELRSYVTKYIRMCDAASIVTGSVISIMFICASALSPSCKPWILPANTFTWILYPFFALYFVGKRRFHHFDIHLLRAIAIGDFVLGWLLFFVLALIFVFSTVGMVEDYKRDFDWTLYSQLSAVLLAVVSSMVFGLGTLEHYNILEDGEVGEAGKHDALWLPYCFEWMSHWQHPKRTTAELQGFVTLSMPDKVARVEL